MVKLSGKEVSKKEGADEVTSVPSVYFLALEVEDVLCFKERQVLDLSNGESCPAQWTVILGDNGVGKTTLLRCLAGMEAAKETFANGDTGEDEVAGFPILSDLSHEISTWPDFENLENNFADISASLSIGANLSGRANKLSNIEVFEFGVQVGSGATGLSWKDVQGLICYGYGATRYLGKISLSETNISVNSASLFSEQESLINAEEWLLQTDYAARTASGKAQAKLQTQLSQIQEILQRILPDVSDIRIAPADEENPYPRAEFLTPYGWVHINSLGLGYRSTIAWTVDLAVRLFKRYPNSPDPLAEPAIVLVDEIDLHLHPRWQRSIMDFLSKRFPNTQFIVTAHSPLVVQAAQNANIVLLRREGDQVVIDNNPEIIENWRVDQVLTSVFELPTARPTEIEPLLLRREVLLDKAKLSKKEKAELDSITEQLGALPTAESPQEIKAMNIIRRAAKYLESK